MDPGAFEEGDLGRQMGRTTEAINAQPSSHGEIGPAKRPIANDASAEKRCSLLVAEGIGKFIRVRFIRDDVFRVAAVDVPAGEKWRRAQVFPPAETEPTLAARTGQPGDPDAGAHRKTSASFAERINGPNDLMAGDNLMAFGGQVALRQVQIGPTDSAHADPEPNLSWSGNRHRPIDLHQGSRVNRPGPAHGPCFHRTLSPVSGVARSTTVTTDQPRNSSEAESASSSGSIRSASDEKLVGVPETGISCSKASASGRSKSWS